MPRRVLEGQVVSDKMDKTVTVLVERRYMHPVYKKYVRRTDKYAAHDEGNSFKIGDRVMIEECSPISKRKTWRVITVPVGGVVAPVKKEPAPAKAAPKKEAAPVAKAAPKKSAEKAKAPAAKKAPAKKTTAKKKDA